MAKGNYGDCSPVGDKSTQEKDIKNAKIYWKDYKENDRTKL